VLSTAVKAKANGAGFHITRGIPTLKRDVG
jgi:hypothetical protein